MPPRALTGHDYLAAAAPLLGTITIAEINQAAQALGTLAGLAYLLWKWRREARRRPE